MKMAKLSPAQDKAIRGLSKGEFPMSTNKRTIDALVSNGYVTEDNTFYDLTASGREYLGVEESVSEITELLTTNPWTVTTPDEPLADWERHLLSTEEKPFLVQEWDNNMWRDIHGLNARTWGTANVRRNLLKSRGRVVRVTNCSTHQVWA
jgi:DNA topoisomerase IA